MTKTPDHIPGSQYDALVQRVAKLEKALAALGNRTQVSTVEGTLTAFNPNDGTNTVTVGQATMTDLPLLVSGAEIGLSAGDTIELAVTGSGQLAIMGKLATPGSANYGASNNGHLSVVANNPGAGFGSSAAGVTTCTATITVPGWANSARVIVLGSAAIHNTSGSLDNLGSRVRADDISGTFAVSQIAFGAVTAGFFKDTYAGVADVLNVTPGAALTFTHQVFSGATWPTDAAAGSTLFAQADFFRESV